MRNQSIGNCIIHRKIRCIMRVARLRKREGDATQIIEKNVNFSRKNAQIWTEKGKNAARATKLNRNTAPWSGFSAKYRFCIDFGAPNGVSEFGLKTHVLSLWPLLGFYGASSQHFPRSWLHFGFLWVAPWPLLVDVASILIAWQPSGAFSSYNFALILQSQMGTLNFS